MNEDVTMNEETLRAALQRQADRAPDPDGVIAGLETRARAVRQRRRLLTAAGGIAVAAAIAGPVMAVRPWVRRDGQVVDPDATQTPLPDALPYQATWLPDGASEHRRVLTMVGEDAGKMQREWRAVVNGKEQKISLVAEIYRPVDRLGPGWTPVDVNGVGGHLHAEKTAAVVRWRASKTITLTVNFFLARYDALPGNRDMYRELALRVARSVRPDGRTRLVTPVRFGWLPPGYEGRDLMMGGESKEAWETSVTAGGERSASAFVRAQLARTRVQRPTAAVPVTVRGLPGWYHAYRTAGDPDGVPRSSLLEAEFGEGLVLRLVTDPGGLSAPAPLTPEALIKVGDDLVIDESPDLGWMA